jgi:hypothetical protein
MTATERKKWGNALSNVLLILCIVIVTFYIFREPISRLIDRVSNISYKGLNVQFAQNIELQISQLDDLRSNITEIIEQAKISSDKAVILGSEMIDRKLRRILAVTNWNNGNFSSAEESIIFLTNLGVLPRNILQNYSVIKLGNYPVDVANHQI